ncbi:hypothetical protein [Streptosporangium sp. LJ11]|uniref:hypothetical protein n=1 Tax=Streptosporangium sp. LJ11 TaxID=3436927 RepID=UPI003F794EA0
MGITTPRAVAPSTIPSRERPRVKNAGKDAGEDAGKDALLRDPVAGFDALAMDVNDDSFRILPLSRRTGFMT